jgi:predicted secreted protein
MAFVHGKGAVIKLDDSTGTLRDLSGYSAEVSLPRSIETAETTTFAATGDAKTYIVGLNDSTMAIKCMWDATLDGYLAPALGADATLSFEYGPAGSGSGAVKFTGEGIMTSYQTSSPVGDVVSLSIDLQITGPVTRGTWA